MNKKTYEALKVVMTFARKPGCDEPYHDEFMQVLDWMAEVEKEIED
jgi:hypothetical protein